MDAEQDIIGPQSAMFSRDMTVEDLMNRLNIMHEPELKAIEKTFSELKCTELKVG